MCCRGKCGLFWELTWHSAGVRPRMTLLAINIALLRSEGAVIFAKASKAYRTSTRTITYSQGELDQFGSDS